MMAEFKLVIIYEPRVTYVACVPDSILLTEGRILGYPHGTRWEPFVHA